MKKKILNFIKKVMTNYGEIAMMQYYSPTGVIPNHKD